LYIICAGELSDSDEDEDSDDSTVLSDAVDPHVPMLKDVDSSGELDSSGSVSDSDVEPSKENQVPKEAVTEEAMSNLAKVEKDGKSSGDKSKKSRKHRKHRKEKGDGKKKSGSKKLKTKKLKSVK